MALRRLLPNNNNKIVIVKLYARPYNYAHSDPLVVNLVDPLHLACPCTVVDRLCRLRCAYFPASCPKRAPKHPPPLRLLSRNLFSTLLSARLSIVPRTLCCHSRRV